MKVLFSTQSAKFWVSAVAAVIIAGLTAYEGVMADGVTTQEVLTIVIAVVSAAMVWLVPNETPTT
jgi:hypothetical protein